MWSFGNITRDVLGYKNNTIVFFSTQGMNKDSSTPVWAKLNEKNLISKIRSLHDIDQSFFI